MGAPDKQDLRDGTALLRITTATKRGEVTACYWVYRSGDVSRLMKMGGGERYTVKGGRCDCPDARKGNDCKHARALAVALPKVK